MDNRCNITFFNIYYKKLYLSKFNTINYLDTALISLNYFLLLKLYACSNEFYQLFMNGRSGEFKYIKIDCT
ncbi:VanZ family protein [Romboutsia ilealis]|uniref:VanZ family protein n=1 Tax=Romboutsia ilealis TaxID=1115758 RepID=UPI003AB92E66